MDCGIKIGTRDFDSLDDVKKYLKESIDSFKTKEEVALPDGTITSVLKDNFNLHESTLSNPLMLIPDFTTKMKVVLPVIDSKGNQAIDSKSGELKYKTVFFDYDTLLSYIKNNIEYDSSLMHPEEVLMEMLKNPSGSAIKIYTPKVSMSYEKKFHGYSLDGVASDVIVEANLGNGNYISGPVSYVSKKLDGVIAEISIIDKTINEERKLKSYDYVLERETDGGIVEESIKDTVEYASLWELYNKKPKNNGKFTDTIIFTYLDFNNIKPERIKAIMDAYSKGLFDEEVIKGVIIDGINHKGLTVEGLTKLAAEFLNTYNLKKATLTDNDLENVAAETKDKEYIDSWEMHYRAFFRKQLTARIETGYKFKHSEASGMMVNAKRLGMDKGDTIQMVEYGNPDLSPTENAISYFKEKLTKNNYLSKVPYYDIFNSNDIYSEKDLNIILDDINDLTFKDYKWYSTFKEKAKAMILADVENADSNIKNLFLNTLSANMYNDIASIRMDAYFKSKIIITSRIPSQAKQSTSISELKIIDNTKDNYLHESHDNFIIKGQDNDGDKLNTMTVQLDMHGGVISYADYLVDGKFEGVDINHSANFVNDVHKAKIEKRVDILYQHGSQDAISEYQRLVAKLAKTNLDSEKEDIQFEINNLLYDNTEISKDEESLIVQRNLNKLSDDIESKTLRSNILKGIDDSYNEKIAVLLASDSVDSKAIAVLLRAKANAKANEIDLYRKAMLNYMIDQIKIAHEKGSNAIEKEIPVRSDVIEGITKRDDINSINDNRTEQKKVEDFVTANSFINAPAIATPIAGEHAIAEGDTLVGTVANYIQLANTMKQIASNIDPELFKNYNGESIDLSYMIPYYVDGVKRFKQKKVVIKNLLAFDEVLLENRIDTESLHSLMDEDGNPKDIKVDIKAYTEWKKLKDKYDNLLEGKEQLKILLDKANELSDAEFTNELYKGKIWEDLSEIMTGAVDNAKLLVLSKLGVNNNNAKIVLSLLLYGTSITDTIAIIRQQDVKEAALSIIKTVNEGGLSSMANEFESISENRANANNNKKKRFNQILNVVHYNKSLINLNKYYSDLFDTGLNKGLQLYTIGGQEITGLSNIDNIELLNVSTDEGTLSSKYNMALASSDTVLFTTNNLDKEDERIKNAVAQGKNVFVISKGVTYSINEEGVAKLNNSGDYFFLRGSVFAFDLNKKQDIDIPIKLKTLTKNHIHKLNQEGVDNLDVFKTTFFNALHESEVSIKKIDNDETAFLKDYNFDYNPAKQLLEFDNLIKELDVLIKVTSFKNGKNNSAYDMTQYIIGIERAINKMFENNGDIYIDFDIVKFATNKTYQGLMISKYNDIKKGMNPLVMLLQSSISRSYLKVIGKQQFAAMVSDDITLEKRILYKRIFKDGPITRSVQGMLDESINSMLVFNYVNSKSNPLKSFKIGDEVINLTTKAGMHKFMMEFPKAIVDVKNNNQIIVNKGTENEYKLTVDNNLLLRHLRNSGYSREEYGFNAEFIKLSKESVDSEITPLIKSDAKKIKENSNDFYHALFIYDLLQAGGSYSKDNISMVLDDELRVNFNNANKSFDFGKIHDIDINYLLLLKPGLLNKKHKDIATSIEIDDNNVISVPITIGTKTIRVPIVRTEISQTGSDIVTDKDGLSMRAIVAKAGYKLGYEVIVQSGDGMVTGRVLAYDNITETYIVELSKGEILNINSEIISNDNKEMVFFKNVFGPSDKVDIEEKEIFNGTVRSKEANLIANGSIRYNIIGPESRVQSLSKYDIGAVLKRRTFGNSLYQFKLKGLVTPSSVDNNFYKALNKDANSYAFDRSKKNSLFTRNIEYAYGEWEVVKRGNDPVPTNRIKFKTMEKMHLIKQLVAVKSDRSPFLWTINPKGLRLNNKGDKGSVSINKYENRNVSRVYVLTNKASGYHWKYVAEQLGIDTSNENVAKNKLAGYLQVDINDHKTDIMKKFFDTNEVDIEKLKEKGELKKVTIISAVPEHLSGSNNTYEETKLLKETKVFNSNITNDVKVQRILSYSPSTEKLYGASLKPTVATVENKLDAKIVSYIKSDYSLLFDVNKSLSADMVNYISSFDDAINNSDAVIIEGDGLINTRDDFEKGSNKRVSNVIVLSKLNNSIRFINEAKKEGIISPKAMLDKLVSLKAIFDANELLVASGKSLNESEVLDKYYASVFENDKYDSIVSEISEKYDYSFNEENGQWEYSPSTGANIGRSREEFANKEFSFVALQMAKYKLELNNENKDLFFYSEPDSSWFKYNYETGLFDKINNIPNLNRNIAYIGEHDYGLSLMAKTTSLKNDKIIDPSYLSPHRFIIDSNASIPSINNIASEDIKPSVITTISDVNKLVFEDGRFFLNNGYVGHESIQDFSTYKVNRYNDGLYTLESEESADIYIINMDDDLRKEYDSIGQEMEPLTVTFQKSGNIIGSDSVFNFSNILKVDKSVFSGRGTTKNVNTKIITEAETIKEYAIKNLNDNINILQKDISKSKEAREDHYSNIYHYLDFMNMLEHGVFDRFITATPYYEAIKKEVLKHSKILAEMKDKYTNNIRVENKKNKLNIIDVNFTKYNNEVKVYFSGTISTDKGSVIKANNIKGSQFIQAQDINGNGFNTNKNYVDSDGKHSEVTTFGLPVSSNQNYLFSKIRDMFVKVANEKESVYINFGEVYDSNGDIIEIYPGITYEMIAKAFAKVLRMEQFSSMTTGSDALIKFNSNAAKMINNTDGVYSMSDINSNKQYRLTDIPRDSFNLHYSINLNEMMIGDYSINQLWNDKLGFGIESENKNIYKTPIKGASSLDSIGLEAKQKEFTNLLKGYYKANHNELISLMRKLKGKNIFVNKMYKGFSMEQSFVDLINDLNSIDFLFKRELKSSDISFDPKTTSTAIITNDKVEMIEGESMRLSNEDGLFKIRSEVKINESNFQNSEGELNPLFKVYGITISNDDLIRYNDHIVNGGELSIVSIIPFSDKVNISNERLTSEDIKNSGYNINNNLNEQSLDKVTIMLPINIKGSVMTRSGLDKSKNIANMIESFGNTSLVTDISANDVVFIKSPNYGDMNSTTQDDFYDSYSKIIPYLNRIVKNNASVILSGGVTINEFVKAFLINNNYGYDKTTGIYSLNIKTNKSDGKPFYKLSYNNMHSIIGNKENGRSGLPFIVSENEESAIAYTGALENTNPDNMQMVTHINKNNLLNKETILTLEMATNISSRFKPNTFNDPDINIKIKLENKIVTYIKLAVAVDLIGDVNLPNDINEAYSLVRNIISNDESLETEYRKRLSGFISDNGNGNTFDDLLSDTKVFNMIADFNATKVYLKEDLGVDVFSLNKNNNFLEISKVAMYQKVYKKSRLYKKFITEEDFDLNKANVLDAFLFSTIVDPNNSFDIMGNIDFGSVPHTFVENGISGIQLSNGNYTLFETMSLFNTKGSSDIKIKRPEKQLDKINSVISSIYSRLNASKTSDNIVTILNNTAVKNIPFTASSNNIVYFTWDGKIKNINLNEAGYERKLKHNLSESIFASVIKSIGLDVNDNIDLTVSVSSDIARNINYFFKGKKGLDNININNLLFNTNKAEIEQVNNSIKNLNVGDIYEYNKEKVIILRSSNSDKIAISETGKVYDNGLNSLDDIYKLSKGNIKSDSSLYLLPSDYNQLGMITIINADGEVEIINDVKINVDKEAVSSDDSNDNVYSYNYNINSWELITDNKVVNEFTNNIHTGHSGMLIDSYDNALTDEQFKRIKLLNISGGMVIRLSDEAVNENLTTITDKGVQYILSKDNVHWDMKNVDDTDIFQLRSDINSITIGNNSFEAQKVSRDAVDKIRSYFKELYPDVNINSYSKEEIAIYFGDKYRNRAAFVYKGEIVFNKDELTLDSPVHELGHLFVNGIKESNPELYIKLLEKAFENTKLMNEIKAKGSFNNSIEIAEEALVLMIGYKSQGKLKVLIDDGAISISTGVLIDSIWDKILKFFTNLFNSSIGSKDVIEVIDMTSSINDIVGQIGDNILFGKESIFNTFGVKEKVIIKNKIQKGNIDNILNNLKSKGFIKKRPIKVAGIITTNKIKCN